MKNESKKGKNGKTALLKGIAGGLVGALASGLINYYLVPFPATTIENAGNNAISGFFAGFMGGFLGIVSHLRKEACMKAGAAREDGDRA